MSNHPHPPQTSCLQRGATGTQHTQGIHQRQQRQGQCVNPVYMVSHEWNVVLGCGYEVSELCCWAREKHTEALEYGGAHVVHTWSIVLHLVLPV